MLNRIIERLAVCGTIVFVVIFIAAAVAHAQQQTPGAQPEHPMVCDYRTQVLKTLFEQYKEVIIARGMTDSGQFMMEVTSNEQSGSWTILLTDSRGCSRFLAAGKHLENIDMLPGEST